MSICVLSVSYRRQETGPSDDCAWENNGLSESQ